MTFHRGSIRLAGFYLAIMMLISLFFSGSVYQLSVQEFDRGLRRPTVTTLSPAEGMAFGVSGGTPAFSVRIPDQLVAERQEQFEEAKNRVIQRLVVINLGILIGGGILSYFLALRTLKPIEEAHESLERFTADASHELRTPITAMRSENEVALMNPKLTLTEAKRQISSNIEELEKLTALSEGLLRLASLEKSGLDKKSTKLEPIVSEAMGRVLQAAETKKILIHADVKSSSKVTADSGSLVETLVILLDNAIKYSPEKSEVTITADTTSKQTVIRVIDNGIGIKASELPHIFDRFYRADSSRTKQHVSGYGLGLAIAHDIVAAHNGTLTAQSKLGKGTTFTITLPV